MIKREEEYNQTTEMLKRRKQFAGRGVGLGELSGAVIRCPVSVDDLCLLSASPGKQSTRVTAPPRFVLIGCCSFCMSFLFLRRAPSGSC